MKYKLKKLINYMDKYNKQRKWAKDNDIELWINGKCIYKPKD